MPYFQAMGLSTLLLQAPSDIRSDIGPLPLPSSTILNWDLEGSTTLPEEWPRSFPRMHDL